MYADILLLSASLMIAGGALIVAVIHYEGRIRTLTNQLKSK